MSIIKAAGAGDPSSTGFFDYEISNSLRLNRGDTSHLRFTPSSSGDSNKIFTLSFWWKRANQGVTEHIFSSVNAGSGTGEGYTGIGFQDSHELYYFTENGGQNGETKNVYRDSSAWYHFCWQYDTSQATDSDRIKFFINGVQIVVNTTNWTNMGFGLYPAEDSVMTSVNAQNRLQSWGYSAASGYSHEPDGYLAEVHMLDGVSTDCTSFGEFKDGIWVPKDYTGSYGTNGYRFEFKQTGTSQNASGIGADTSGNNNHFAVNNIVASDVVPDSPTNNFAVMNPIDKDSMTVSEGNLKVVPSGDYKAIRGTFGIPTSGKWYFEARILTPGGGNVQDNQVGIVTASNVLSGSSPYPQAFTYGVGYLGLGQINRGGSAAQSSLTAFTAGKILGVAVNVDDDEVQFYLDGSAVGTTHALVSTTEPNFPFYVGATNRGVIFNFGQDSTFTGAVSAGGNSDSQGIGDFAYAPPSGHLALCASNLPDITIGPGQDNQANDFFDTILYLGNGNELAVGTGGMRRPLDTVSIAQSLRFNRSDEQELKKTFDSGGNRRKWTFSTWIKRTSLLSSGNDHYIFGTNTGSADSTFMMLVWRATDALAVTGQSTLWLKSTRAFQDTRNFYHVVWVLDSDNSTNAEKMRLYVNGTELTAFATDSRSSLSGDQAINAAAEHNFGVHPSATGYGLDAYLAETIFVDGQAYGPEQFGQVGANDDWIPKAYSGGYGTTGFKLTYADGSALGDDTSGNTNDFSSANLDATDKVFDSPTQNFATFDPTRSSGTTLTYSEGNLKAERTSTQFAQAYSNVVITEGKFYAEFYLDVGNSGVGVITGNTLPGSNKYLGQDSYTYAYYFDGRKVNNNSYTSYGDSYTVAADGSSDIVGVMIDADNGQISFTKNGTVQNSGTPAFSGLTGPYRFAIASEGGIGSGNCFHIANFGQDDSFNGLKTSGSAVAADGNGVGRFYDTPPTGFLALMNDNLPRKSDVIGPDWVWIKGRSNTTVHSLHDTLRGTQLLQSSASDGQQDNPNYLLSFDSQGFTVGNSSNVNQSNNTYVGWVWRAGGTPTADNSAANNAEPTAGSAKIDGSNQSGAFSGSPSIAIKKLSASTTAGFSIVRWTGTGSAGTIPHGLGAVPKSYIVKNITDDSTNWQSYHAGIASDAETDYIYLNTTAAADDSDDWNDTAPTANVFSVKTHNQVNASGDDYIAYLFAPIEGYSKFGSYKGNFNADGPFIYTGFRPAWLMLKRTDSADSWLMRDSKRDPFNVTAQMINANATSAEYTDSTLIDFVSNGFKLRHQNSLMNASGGNFIYFCFAEAPFKFSNAR